MTLAPQNASKSYGAMYPKCSLHELKISLRCLRVKLATPMLFASSEVNLRFSSDGFCSNGWMAASNCMLVIETSNINSYQFGPKLSISTNQMVTSISSHLSGKPWFPFQKKYINCSKKSPTWPFNLAVSSCFQVSSLLFRLVPGLWMASLVPGKWIRSRST